MKTLSPRVTLSGLFIVIATAILWLGFHTQDTNQSSLWLNIGTEIIGIVLTVAIVDWLFEKRRVREEAEKMAWRALDQLDHAVWVWQGGARQFDLGELKGLLSLVTTDDPVPQFTQNLFMQIAGRAAHTLQVSPEVMKASEHLQRGLKECAALSNIRDHVTVTYGPTIAQHCLNAVGHLCQVLGLQDNIVPDPDLTYIRRPSVQDQRWRHFGEHPKLDDKFDPA